MSTKTPKPSTASKKSKLVKIQEIYGLDTANATLEQTSNYLKSKGFKSLADLLTPATK